jgi:hypothetical protein
VVWAPQAERSLAISLVWEMNCNLTFLFSFLGADGGKKHKRNAGKRMTGHQPARYVGSAAQASSLFLLSPTNRHTSLSVGNTK